MLNLTKTINHCGYSNCSKFSGTENIAVKTLNQPKNKSCRKVPPKDVDGRANREEQSDQGLHCLLWRSCLKTMESHGTVHYFSVEHDPAKINVIDSEWI